MIIVFNLVVADVHHLAMGMDYFKVEIDLFKETSLKHSLILKERNGMWNEYLTQK